MRYVETSPAPDLAAHVRCFWWMSSPGGSRQPETIVPDGCLEIMVDAADPFRELQPDGRTTRQPRRMVAGQLQRALVIVPGRVVDVVGVRLTPAGARSLLGDAVPELTDRVEDLDVVQRALGRQLEQAVLVDPRWPQRVAALQRLLRRELAHAPGLDPLVHAATRLGMQHAGALAVDDLARAVGVSTRHLGRRFGQVVGLSPKAWLRTVRFQEVFAAVEYGPPGSWADVAVRCGFHDQAHLVREFRRFAGEPPAAFFAGLSDLTAALTRAGRGVERVRFVQDELERDGYHGG